MSDFSGLKREASELAEFTASKTGGADGGLEPFLIASALRIWGCGKTYAEEYSESLSALFGCDYSKEQVLAAFDAVCDREAVLNPPAFFYALAESDAASGASESRAFLDRLNRFLVGMAFVNGDFSIEEASELTGITGRLAALCDGLKVAPRAAEYVVEEHITPGPDSPAEGKPLAAAEKPELPLDALLAELDGLVGLQGVKSDVHSLINFIKVCQIRGQRGLAVPPMPYHLVFTGNPGTGKTTVAQLIAQIYSRIGLLPTGQLVEADRGSLVAGYLGQTARKTKDVINSAIGGVLLINEAYSLAGDRPDSYGAEAIETLLMAMEESRDKLVVIAAGCDEPMRRFIGSNPGLRSRFNKFIPFPDYSASELFMIFARFCSKNGYVPGGGCEELLTQKLAALPPSGGARTVRSLFERTINRQADRLSPQANPTDSELALLLPQDLEAAFGDILGK